MNSTRDVNVNRSSNTLEEETSEIFEKYHSYIVSLSEPYQHDYTLQGTELNEPAGGLTAALDPILQRYGGAWIATATGDADWEFVDDWLGNGAARRSQLQTAEN